MSNLKSWLKKYLGDNTLRASPNDLIQATEFLNLHTPDGVIRAIEETVKLDIPVTAAFFMRDIPSRYRKTGELIEAIVGKGNKNTPLQHMSTFDLKRAPKHIREAYQILLDEFYELAVMLHLAIKLFGARDSIQATRTQWEHYLYLADGHPDQKDRIQIARQQLESLSSTT